MFMNTQLESIRFVSLLSCSLNKMYSVRKVVGITIKVANKGNLRHQKTSLSNHEVKWASCLDHVLNGFFIPMFLLIR